MFRSKFRRGLLRGGVCIRRRLNGWIPPGLNNEDQKPNSDGAEDDPPVSSCHSLKIQFEAPIPVSTIGRVVRTISFPISRTTTWSFSISSLQQANGSLAGGPRNV